MDASAATRPGTAASKSQIMQCEEITMTRTITTVDELKALPVGSGFVDKHGDLGLIDRDEVGPIVQYVETDAMSLERAARYLPGTVVYVHGETCAEPAPAPAVSNTAVSRGLAQSAAGETVDLGDFTQYLIPDAAEEAYQRGFQDGFWNGKTTDMSPAQVAAFMAPYRARDLSLDKRLAPLHPLGDKWKVGARVERVHRRGPYGPEETRPGTVERIDRTYGYHESLVVRFDDGEVRDINPDVMRHIRTEA